MRVKQICIDLHANPIEDTVYQIESKSKYKNVSTF